MVHRTALAAGGRGNRPSLQGSVFWMAPEVVKQTAHTSKADIWSVGCLVVEMFTGEHPWAQLSQMQAIFKVCTPSGHLSQILTMYSSDRLVLLQNQPSLRISRQRRMLSFSSPSTLITKSARLRQNLCNTHGSSYPTNNQSQHSNRKRLLLTDPFFRDFLLLFVCSIATRLFSSLYCRCAHRMILDSSI
jgi:serine/threonine protein kinase